MNKSLLIHEFNIISKSKKNIFFSIFLAALLLSFCFIVLPNKQTTESFNPEIVSQELKELSVLQREREEKGFTGIVKFTGMPVYAMNEYYYKLHRNMITAFEDQDFKRFALLRTHYLEGNQWSFPADQTLFLKSPYPGKDSTHLYLQTLLRYQGYLNQDIPISYDMIEQKTALQTLQNLLLGFTPYLIILCAIYFSSDVLIRDRQNQTILQGFPLSWYRVLNIKTLVAFLFTFFVLTALTIVGMIIVSLQGGFGSFTIQMPVMITQKVFTLKDYDIISIAQFLAKSLSFIPILVYLFIRLNIVLSLLFKNEWIVLMISSLFLFSERLYFSRTLRELFGIEISNFPQTYFEFGKVISGEKNFLVNIETVTYAKGLIVLISAIVIIECVLFIVSRIINKRRFYQKK